MRNCPKETDEQRAVAEYLRYRGLLFSHTPNEGKRTPATAGILKSMGMSPGFPDLFIYEPRGKYHGLAIEMKSKTGKPSEGQIAWLSHLNKRGYAAYIAYGADEAIRIIETNDKEGT